MAWQKIKRDPADTFFSQYIRLRDKKCLRCGRPGIGEQQIGGLQASHFQGRRKENTRFDERNVCSLDAGCHAYFTAHPAEHYLWQVDRLGQEVVDEIVFSSNLYVKKDRLAQAFYWKKRLKDDFGVG